MMPGMTPDHADLDLSDADLGRVTDYLAHRGIVATGPAHKLTGGVSGTVLQVPTSDGPRIVKQARDRLATAGEWRAERRRTVTEGHAIELLHALTPEHTARLVALDPAAMIVVMTCAPTDWLPWKDQLLARTMRPEAMTTVAATLGRVLGRWHRSVDDAMLADFDDHETFRALRSDPFYRRTAEVHPRLAGRLDELADSLDEARGCLMHGDFSPKNVLADPGVPGRLWVVDHEVVVNGAPVFDVAFMLSHLACKAIRSPSDGLLHVAAAFRSAYEKVGLPVEDSELVSHTAVLMLARGDGVSPVHYLGPAEQNTVRDAARSILTSAAPRLEQLWHRITVRNHR